MVTTFRNGPEKEETRGTFVASRRGSLGGTLRVWGGLLVFLLAVAAAPAAALAGDDPDDDGDGYPASMDCNDNNAQIHPGAVELCNGVDDNCNGVTDEDPDPVNLADDNNNGFIDDGFGFCVFAQTGPSNECKTAGRLACSNGTLSCENANNGNQIIQWAPESLSASGSCADGSDNDCDGKVDIADPDCQQPEICDSKDNDGDGVVDDGFDVGGACQSSGVGVCVRDGVYTCSSDHTGVVCSASQGSPQKEGVHFGNSCGDGLDNDCDGLSDLADPDCAGFGVAELCNGIDDDQDGTIDEGFALGLPCSEGKGMCTAFGTTVCSADGTGTQCSAQAGSPGFEGDDASCTDFLDNDCDGLVDAKDADCAPSYADLGVTCALPFENGKPGMDCTGWNLIQFSGGSATEVKADLLALDTDGSLLGIIENVHAGDEAHLASRLSPGAFKVDSKTNKQGTKHTMFAPMPVLRVVGKKNGVEDVAYCSIMPYLDVTSPDGLTISLNDTSNVDVKTYLPLVNVDTLSIKLDGVDILPAIGVSPASAFPTGAGALCTNSGDCVFQVQAGCGDGTSVPVEVSNLRVEGLDTTIVSKAIDGVEQPSQVNTLSFTLKGLPAGGHIVYVNGNPLPLPKVLSKQCYVDDLSDTGKMSAFGISVTSPTDQQVVASAPVHVEGTVCGGNPIDTFQINGRKVDASGQTCTTGNGTTTSDECYLQFDVPMPEKDLAQAAQANAPQGSFKRGSNRVIADASDTLGNRAFNTDVVFGLGTVQSPSATAAMALELNAQKALTAALSNIKLAMTTDINPAFVAGLKEDAAKKFFNAKCTSAITDFTNSAQAALQNADLGTVSLQPDCSCDLNNVPVHLDELTFDNSVTSCDVDFVTGQINVSIKLPKIRIQAGAHDSCTDHGLFGECIARTKLDVTAVTRIENIKFDFAITENQIETKTPPDPASFTFAWTVLDPGGNPLFKNAGACVGGIHDGKECFFNGMCEGGACVGAVKNTDKDQPGHFDPVTQNNSGIECWGADVCTFFEAVGAVFIDVFTFGLVDGFDVIGFLDFDVDFNKDLLDDLNLKNPDPMEVNELQVDESTVKDAGSVEFTPGPIDVTIEDGGLTAAIPAEFSVQSVDPEINPTPGAVVTPASAPTVSQVIQVGDDVTMLIADDVFNQMFAALKTTGKLKTFCTPIDGLTVDDLLPAETDGGCESLGTDNVVGATIRGMCHAIRNDDCSTLPDEGGVLLNNTKQGVCVGFRGGDCTTLPFGPKQVCNITPYRDIQSTDGILVCARQDMEPDFLIAPDDTTDATVDTTLLMEDLNVVFALDRNNDGAYDGTLEDLPGCFAASSNGAPDCKVFASCLDLTISARMGIDPTQCRSDQAGFVFSNLNILKPASNIDFGVMCNAPTTYDDELVLLQSFESKVIDTINQAAEKFTPPMCVDGLTLGGVLDFSSADAKLFGLTTDGGTGYADFLGLTVGLKP